ncbi:hypothetical protein CY35_04G042400 [Sphagnum magellanicum]|nr:hypothetical protein CY35_04G042400 [Sphagnum magellanicum]
MLLLAAILLLALLLFLLLLQSLFRFVSRKKERVVGFFHPFTNDGGGGERVLWCAVRAVQEMATDLPIVIYTGDPATSESLALRALDRFGVKLLQPIRVVRLQRRKWVEARTYPRLTLIGQSLGSMVLAWEALSAVKPLLFIDTSGYAFTYVVASWIAGSFVACYTHYPTISSDMLARVRSRTPLYNNHLSVTRSYWLTTAKVLYYRVVAWMYGLAGACAHVAMVNSSWTQAHINRIWRIPNRTFLVYPPCDTLSLQALPLERPTTPLYIVSVAQFRPEKAHELQLEAFAMALNDLPPALVTEVQLKFIGSCRHQEDEERVEALRDKCHVLGLQQRVEFCLNVSYRELVKLLGGAIAGLHTMTDEHFGISVVEYMAAGAVVIAHDSAGPKLDIVVEEAGQPTGFLASSTQEYAAAIRRVLLMPDNERLQMTQAARHRASLFSEAMFDTAFKKAMSPLLTKCVDADLGLLNMKRFRVPGRRANKLHTS